MGLTKFWDTHTCNLWASSDLGPISIPTHNEGDMINAECPLCGSENGWKEQFIKLPIWANFKMANVP